MRHQPTDYELGANDEVRAPHGTGIVLAFVVTILCVVAFAAGAWIF